MSLKPVQHLQLVTVEEERVGSSLDRAGHAGPVAPAAPVGPVAGRRHQGRLQEVCVLTVGAGVAHQGRVGQM